MRVLLLYPEFPDTFWSFKHALKFIRKKAGHAAAGPADRGRHAAGRLGEAPGRPERAEPERRGPGVGRHRLRQRHDRAAGCRPGRDRALQAGRHDGRGRRTALRRRARAVSRGGPLRAERGRDDAAPVPARPGSRTPAARLRDRGVPRHPPDARAPLGAGGPAALRHGEHPVLARLPVRLRLLQRHRAARPPAAHQDRRADHRRAGQPVRHRLARQRLLRRRQLHRQQEAPQDRGPARADRMAQGQGRACPSAPRPRSTWPTTPS